MFRLRIASGIDPTEYEKLFLLPFAPIEKAMGKFREQGWAQKTFDGRWHLTPTGFLVSNTIISDLLLIQEKTKPLTRR